MIPTKEDVLKLWDKYHLPKKKRIHAELVAKVADFLANAFIKKKININKKLVTQAALLHDIDKNVPKLAGEKHPDSGVRILTQEGMFELVEMVKTHPLQSILEPQTAPKTWEEKILFLSDKMVKNKVLTVDKRFELWRKELLPQEFEELLKKSYPKVKELEKEIMQIVGFSLENIAKLIK